MIFNCGGQQEKDLSECCCALLQLLPANVVALRRTRDKTLALAQRDRQIRKCCVVAYSICACNGDWLDMQSVCATVRDSGP